MTRAERVVVQPPRTVRISEPVACDNCGKPISLNDHLDYAHELVIALDQGECVNFYRQRDLCPPCLGPIWESINKLIKADPDEERDREYDY